MISAIARKIPAKFAKVTGPDFSTVWASGVSIGTITGTFPGSSGSGYRYQITGVDSFTGKDVVTSLYPIFGSGATLSIYRIVDAVVADQTALDGRMKSQFQTTTDRNPNGRDLYRELTLKSASPQINLIIDRPNADGSSPPATDVNEFYMIMRVKIDANVNTNLAVGQYIEVFFNKTGGYAGNYYGDFRQKVEINMVGGGTLIWRGGLDNNANGNVGIPSVAAEFAANSGAATLYQDSWPTYAAAVTPGWNTLEIYSKRPTGGRSDLTTGRFWARVTPDGGSTLQICDFIGGIQAGLENLPFNRIGISNLYSNGAVPNNLIVGATEIWPFDPSTRSATGVYANHTWVAPLAGIAHEINGVLASPEALSVYRQSFRSGGSLLQAASLAALPDTGYPVIESITQSTFTPDATSHAVSMPATVNSGDGLVVVLTTDGSPTITTPSGWKRLYILNNGTALQGAAYAKVARGTEGGTTVDFVTSAAETLAAQVYRISNWNGTLAGIQAGTAGSITAGTTADPPNVTSYWGTAKTLWIATVHTSTSQTVSTAPTSYTGLTQTTTGTATTDAQCATAIRQNEVSAEDPGVFTMSGTGASKVYNTIAIAPAYVGMKYEHVNFTQGASTLWVGMYASQPSTVTDTNITRAVIVLHGQSLDAAEYANVVRKNMESYLGKAIVLAPFFAESDSAPETGQLFWGSTWPELGRSDPSLAFRVSSGEVLDTIISLLYSTFPNLEGVVIAGHSAGGQLTNRYSAASADTRNRYLVSAASSYVYPDTGRANGTGGWYVPTSPSTFNDWKYGLNNLSSISYVDAIGATAMRDRLRNAKVTYMVGALDNNPADTSMDASAEATLQGEHRVKRQQNYYLYLRYWDR